MGSFQCGASAGDSLLRWDQLGAAAFDFLDTALDLDSPSLLDLVVLKQTCNQSVRKLRPLFGRKLQRLRFNCLKLT